MKKKRNWHWLRIPRHAGEKRAYYRNPEYVRAKRKPNNLPDPWDDVIGLDQKTWKVKRKKQYRSRNMLNEYCIKLYFNDYSWYLINYLDELNIPYKEISHRRWNSWGIVYWAEKPIPEKYINKILWRKRDYRIYRNSSWND